MSRYIEKFQELWGKSFGEDILLEKPLKPGIYPVNPDTLEPYPPELIKQEPVGILRRVWNDAILGGDHRSREMQTPLTISAGRTVGRALGIGLAVGTVGTGLTGMFTSVAAVPVLPALSLVMGMGAVGGALYGAFTKPEQKKPYEQLVHVDRGAGVRDYDTITIYPPAPGLKDKLGHIVDCMMDGWKMPLVVAYRAINAPIRLASYAVHGLGTAAEAAVSLRDDAPPPALRPLGSWKVFF